MDRQYCFFPRRYSMMSIPLLFVASLSFVAAYDNKIGPWVLPTKGAVWPHPKYIAQSEEFLILQPDSFTFETMQYDCDILRKAVLRYGDVIRKNVIGNIERTYVKSGHKHWPSNSNFKGYLQRLVIILQEPCEVYPHLRMNESYNLQINTIDTISMAMLKSKSIWGILRGLESFVQLTVSVGNKRELMLKTTSINDEPRFPHRGLLIDTSRHYLPKEIILKMLDAMECNKMNVLHWHIVDDQSFPFRSLTYPTLSGKGAYDPDVLVYTHADVKEIIEYARIRGIRILPEFDTPGHTQSWGGGIPNLLTPCYGSTYPMSKPTGTFGPIDPSFQPNYIFLQNLYQEILALFPEKYVHLGGDEVDFACWRSNPNISRFMDLNNITGDYARLEELYMQKLLGIVESLRAGSIVWQEVFQHGVKLPINTMIHIWTGSRQRLLQQVTSSGHFAILSTCWYLDHVAMNIYGGGGDWRRFYDCEPTDFEGTPEQKKFLLGGEACMWGEYVDETNIIPRVWPRASAVAEKLWSPIDIYDTEAAAQRLEEHVCRMRRRGISAQPANGPSVCL